jgi:hypothetical protein
LCHSLEGLACQIHLPSQSILQIKKWCLTQTTGMGRGDGRRPTLVGGERDGMERGGGRARRGEGAGALTPYRWRELTSSRCFRSAVIRPPCLTSTRQAQLGLVGRHGFRPAILARPCLVRTRPSCSTLAPAHLGSSQLGLGPPALLDLGPLGHLGSAPQGGHDA